MLFKSQVYTQVSGSIGGITYSHNSAGMYSRARAIPVNPSTTQQSVVRGILGSLAQTWMGLSAANQTSWTVYAENNPVLNKFGDPLILTGQQMFIRCNSIRRRLQLSTIGAGPTTMGMIGLSETTTIPAAGTINCDTTYDNTDGWANETGGALGIFISRQQAPSINYYTGPYLLAAVVAGDDTTPPTSPITFPHQDAETYLAGNKVFAKVVAVGADGRISMHELTEGVAV